MAWWILCFKNLINSINSNKNKNIKVILFINKNLNIKLFKSFNAKKL